MPVGTAITWEEFLAAGEEGQRWEWVDGGVEFMSPAGMQHEEFLVFLCECLGRFCRSNSEWKAFASNAAFTLASGNWRMPDASLVRRARLPQSQLPSKCDFAPDVAFEVLSPSDSLSSMQRKRRDYQESGVVQVWFNLDERLVEVLYPDRPSRYFEEDQMLTLETVPGLSIDLKQLYSA